MTVAEYDDGGGDDDDDDEDDADADDDDDGDDGGDGSQTGPFQADEFVPLWLPPTSTGHSN